MAAAAMRCSTVLRCLSRVARVLLLLAAVAATPAASPLARAKSLIECNVCKTSQLTGTVDDCCTDFTTVDEATAHFFLPVLTELQKKSFFKFFKVKLDRECPFWEEDGQCFLRDCSICDCPPEDIPQPWLEQDKSAAAAKAASSPKGAEAEAAVEKAATMEGTLDVVPEDSCQEQIRKEKECKEHSATEKQLGKVDLTQASPTEGLFEGWLEPDTGDVWAIQDDEEEGMRYVNLELNPEKFTGYSGASAQKVWRSIYSENCFGMDDTCKEKRVFFRLLSGLQSSITTQIANDYRFDDGHWGPNVELFLKAVGAHPDRMTNLYFAYLFTLRAVAKAAPLLLRYDYSTGHPEEDAITRQLMESLALATNGSTATTGPNVAVQSCLSGFDETGLFQPQSEPAQMLAEGVGYLSPQEPRGEAELRKLQGQFMARFQNISRIMDCVGCEKCKLWGKLETLGLGTAIKIMLPSPDGRELESLNRNELIALVNTAAQLAKSVGSVPNWRWLEVKLAAWQWAAKAGQALFACAGAATILMLVSGFLRWTRPKGKKGESNGAAAESVAAVDGKTPGSSAGGDDASGARTANGAASGAKNARDGGVRQRTRRADS